jgi:hypothetical protein
MNELLLSRAREVRSRVERVQAWIPQLQSCAGISEIQRIVVGCVGIRVRTNVRHLCIGGESPFDAEYLSWSARNLFELSIWAQYVTVSEGNATRFRNDESVDFAEWQMAAVNLARKYAPTHAEMDTLESQGDWLEQKRSEQGIAPDQKHLNIGGVAKELGLAGLFYGMNGFLSKLVHPTALSVLLQVDQRSEQQLREGLMTVGIGGAEDALRHLAVFCELYGMTDCALV